MFVQTAATPINPFKVFRPLSRDEKLQIREAKKLANERLANVRRGTPHSIEAALMEAFGEEGPDMIQSYYGLLGFRRRIEREWSIKGDPVQLVSGDVSLIVDYALIRRFLNTFKPASDWRVQVYLSDYGGLHLRFDYEHKQPLGGHGKAKFVGLPDIHVKVLSRIGLPEIHI